MTVSTANWTTEQTAKIENFASAQENGKITNDQIKSVFEKDPLFSGKSTQMLRGKILNLGYYEIVKKAVGTIDGKAPAKRKMAYVQAIETMLSKEKGSFASFEKASKLELEALSDALIALSDNQSADNIATAKTAISDSSKGAKRKATQALEEKFNAK
jgi:hypothetical protein